MKRRTTWHESVSEMQEDLDAYIETYNRNRPHRCRGMEGRTPHPVLTKGIRKPRSRKKSTNAGTSPPQGQPYAPVVPVAGGLAANILLR